MLKILFLPGLDGSGFCFPGAITLLSRDYECRMLSYPSHMSNYADLCEWVCNQLDLESDYVIVGYSYGGPLALLVAEALEGQVKGLVLCASFCRPPMPRSILWLLSRLYPLTIRFGWMLHFINFFLCNGDSLPVAADMHRILMQSNDATIARRIRILGDLDMRPGIASLTLPCLAIRATKDRLVRFGQFSHLLSNGTLVELDGPHGLMELRAEAVAQAISAFIKTKI